MALGKVAAAMVFLLGLSQTEVRALSLPISYRRGKDLFAGSAL